MSDPTKKAEPAEFSMAQLNALIEAIPGAVAGHAGEELLLANQAMCDFTGYSRDQLLAMKFWDVFQPRMREAVKARSQARLRGVAVPTRYEVAILTAHGEERWADIVGTRMRVDGLDIALGSYLDTTDRRRAEALQLQAQKVLAQIIDGSPVPTFVIDKDHRITHWNKACEQIIGIPAADMVGTRRQQTIFYDTERPAMADLIVDGGMEQAVSSLYSNKSLKRSQLIEGAYEAEDFFPHFGKSGSWLYFTAAPLTDADGRVSGAVETLRDVTEQRAAESALIKSKRELEHLVATRGEQLREATRELEADVARRERAEAELTRQLAELSALNADLNQAQQQLVQSEKLASIGQLAAGVAHEINNPIGFVQSNLGSLERYFEDLMRLLEGYQEGETLLGDAFKNHPAATALIERMKKLKQDTELDYLKDDIPDLLRESKDGIVRVKKIVADLKDFSRVDTRNEWEWADLRTGLDSTLNVVNNEIKYRADVVKDYGEIPQIRCLPSQLNQVFMNLLVNAAQAMPEGRHGAITIRCGAQEGGVWVEIADNGAGIPEENLQRIFDPFFTTKPVGKGTGLGLSLSYGIIQKHGGRFEVKSILGEGTCFHISLPVEPPEADANEVLGSSSKQ